jgi:DNA mismatch repair protein MutL
MAERPFARRGAAIYGMLEIPEDPGGATICVQGFVGPPSRHRANRREITLFVNGRWVQDVQLTHAVVQAYHTLLPTKRYPVAVILVTMPPGDVDVNVHPAKSEVRFRDGGAVFRAVQRAVRHAIAGSAPASAAFTSRPTWPGFRVPEGRPPAWTAQTEQQAIQPALIPQELPSGMPVLRLVGQVGATYIVAEGPEGLYLIDQHAAHERVLYERMMAQQEEGIPSQALLEATTVDLSPEAVGLVEAHLEMLRCLGFDLEPFGGNAFLVRALPAALAYAHPAEVLVEVAEALAEGRSQVAEETERAVMRRVCKQAAVKAGQVLTREEMEGLVRALERCAGPRTCPHGRPTMIHISVAQLAREFGRE